MRQLLIAMAGILLITGCSTMSQGPQPLPPVKVITETVQLEIYQPPLPQEIRMQDVKWSVITNTPCKPATGENRNPKYYTTERFQYDEVVDETTGETKRQVSRDADGNRIELPPLKDDNGNVIQVCGNLEQKIAEIEKELGGEFVILAITPKGYENMAYNLQEIKRYINQQKEIILYYREATDAGGNDDKEDWLEKNTERQQDQIQDTERDNDSQAQQISQDSVKTEESTGFSIGKLIPGIGKD